jgi:hypothetical protein
VLSVERERGEKRRERRSLTQRREGAKRVEEGEKSVLYWGIG